MNKVEAIKNPIAKAMRYLWSEYPALSLVTVGAAFSALAGSLGGLLLAAVGATTLGLVYYGASAPMEGQPGASEPDIGAPMSDGTVYAGTSPSTGRPIYAMAADAPVAMTFNEAAEFASKLNAEKYLGHSDWHVPTKNELNVLFNNRAKIGGFNGSCYSDTGWYRSATVAAAKWYSWCQRLSDGYQTNHGYEYSHLSLRLVR